MPQEKDPDPPAELPALPEKAPRTARPITPADALALPDGRKVYATASVVQASTVGGVYNPALAAIAMAAKKESMQALEGELVEKSLNLFSEANPIRAGLLWLHRKLVLEWINMILILGALRAAPAAARRPASR
eukprot:tig00000498_g1575.t1